MQALNPRWILAARRHGPKLAAVAGLAVAALAMDRLTHLPTAHPILDDRKWEVPVGHELVLGGIRPGSLLTIESAAGDGIKLEAGPVRLDDGRIVRSLSWQVSKLDGNAVGDNKVKVQIDAAGRNDRGSVVVQRSGEDVRPELLIGSAAMPLRVEAGLAIGSLLAMPPIAVIADGEAIPPAGLGLGFTLLPGGDVSLAFPTHPDGTPKGLTILPGERERKGPRLRLREIGLRSEDSARPWKSACAAPAGDHLWNALVRGSTMPAGADCDAGPPLAVTALGIGNDRISADLAGSAYVTNANAPATARWWSWALANPVLGAVILLLMAALARWFWKTASGRDV